MIQVREPQYSQAGRRSSETSHEAIRHRDRKSPSNYAADVPDLPGCVATGATVEETEQLLREAIELHVEGMREDGISVPEPSSRVEYLKVNA